MIDPSRRLQLKLAASMLMLLGVSAIVERTVVALTGATSARADLGHVLSDLVAPAAVIVCAFFTQPWLEQLGAIVVAFFVVATAFAVLLITLDRFGTSPQQPGWLIGAGLGRAALDHLRALICKRLDGRLGETSHLDAKGDVSAALLPALSGGLAVLGFPQADPWIAMGVFAFVAHAGWEAWKVALRRERSR